MLRAARKIYTYNIMSFVFALKSANIFLCTSDIVLIYELYKDKVE